MNLATATSGKRTLAEVQSRDRPASTTKWSRSADCTSSAPSATNPAASTTSSAAAPAARAIPAAPVSTSLCRTICSASSAASACRTSCCAWAWKRTCRSSRKLITKRIAAAQKAVEAQNFEARKHLLEYDDVMNKQRQAVYGMRRGLLEGMEQKERVIEMVARHRRQLRRHALPGSAASRHLGSDRLSTPTCSASSATRSSLPNSPA